MNFQQAQRRRPLSERAEITRITDAARAALPGPAFKAAHHEGAAFTPEETIARLGG